MSPVTRKGALSLAPAIALAGIASAASITEQAEAGTTWEQFASKTFEPWPQDAPLPLFSAARWKDFGETHAMVLNTAYVTMLQTKDELKEAVGRYADADEADSLFDLIDTLRETSKVLDEMAAMCLGAHTRLLCAAAAVEAEADVAGEA